MTNATMTKFGYPATLVAEYAHWAVLLRPQAVTLGSLVLAAKSDATAYSDLLPEAFAEQAAVVGVVEAALSAFIDYAKINYLMLMMVDPHVHFHVIPRYEGVRRFDNADFADQGWPGMPNLAAARTLKRPSSDRLISELRGCGLV